MHGPDESEPITDSAATEAAAMPTATPTPGDRAAVERLHAAYEALRAQAGKVIVGQDAVLEQLLIAVFARGHCLLVGVPGLAKTLMVRTLADALSLSYNRIQFTPDLMPADITGTEIIEMNRTTGEREFRFLKGPIFANLVLADEINRTPPKTQAALLEAMQEMQVTVGGLHHPLAAPFFVLATQNPIEQEGTYPLPEAQLDRFMFMVLVDYPSEEEEYQIVRQTTADFTPTIDKVLDAHTVLELQHLVRRVPVADHLIRYATQLARQTRLKREANLFGVAPTASTNASGKNTNGSATLAQLVQQYVTYGAGPRASQFLVLAGKARAVLQGRYFVTAEDIRTVALPVFRHRLQLNFNAEADGMTPDRLIQQLLQHTPIDESERGQHGNLPNVFRSADAS